MFGVIFNKTANNVGITVEYMDQKTLQLPQFIQLNLSETYQKFANDSMIGVLSILHYRFEDTRILSLTTCSKFNWKVLNQLRKLDYGCTMTSDGIKKADKRAFEMKDCIFEEIGNEECKAGEFNSSSCEKEMMDKNLFFNADINVKYFVKSGIGKLFGTSNNKTSHVKTDYSYSFIMYGKALLKLNFEHLEPTQEFIKVVEKALSSKDPAEQFKQIVKDFGQFIPTEVILGGRVHFDDFAKSVKLSTEKSGEMSGKLSIEDLKIKMEEYRKPINFKLEFPTDIKKIIKNKDVNCKIFATVTDITKSKNDFFTCQVLCPSDGRLPSLIIHRVQNPFKIFKKRECKLHIGWMVIGYYRDFYFDFSTRLKIQKNDFNAPDTDNLIEYDSKVPICLGTPVLSEYPKNESLIIGYYYYVQEEMNKIKACTFAYCLEDRQLVNLPNFTFYTLIITNYHNHGTCDLITLRKKGYSNFNTESPKFVSIYSAEQTDCVFLKQRNGQIKIKKIGNDKTNLSYKCAIFDPYTREDSIQEQSKLDKRTTKYDSQNKIAAFDNHQLEDKDDIINKLQQQTEKLERKLNEETRKYQVSRDKLDVGKSSKLSEEKSELNEEKSELDEETIKHQDSIENFTALNDQLITKDINKFRQQTEKLERQLNEETGKYQVFRDKFTSFNKKLKDKKVAENEDNFAQEIEKNENEIETFKRYEKSAKQDDSNFYRYGWGIEKDEIEAQKWYKKLAGPHNKFFVKNEELLQNINAENKETIINDITNDNPFNYIQFNEPIINTNCEIDSIFITVKATISPGISDTSYIEVEKLQKLLINRKDDIDHILELQPVYTIGIDFQKNSTRPCVACWVAKSLDITVLECLETIFENQFNIIYKIVTPLNEDNNQNLNKSKEFDDNSLTIYYNEENLEEENRNKNNYGNSSGSGSNNDHNSNNNNGNNNNGNNNNGSNSNNNKSGDDSNNISNNNSGDGSNNNNGGGDDGGNGGGGSNGNKSIFISSRVNAVFDSKYSQDFRINVELWANFEDTLKYNLDVYACGIGELLNNTCQSLNKIGFGYILQSIKVQVSPLPNNGGDLFDLKRGSQPTQLNQNVEFLVGSEMNINGNIGISTTPGVDITGGYKKNNNTKYSSREWEFNYKGPIDKGEYWLYERNKNLDKIDSTYAPGVHSGEWFVKNGMHGFCITITQVLRYEITHWWHKIPLNMKTSLQKFPMMAHNLEVTFNDLNDFNNKFKKLKPTMYSTNGNITNTVGSNEMENKVKTPNIENLNEIGKIERSLGSV
ncbi:unnamed protein product [Rhizophagus irregularis]|nr:unnamed protein product [Rhizophagus irregularis]